MLLHVLQITRMSQTVVVLQTTIRRSENENLQVVRDLEKRMNNITLTSRDHEMSLKE